MTNFTSLTPETKIIVLNFFDAMRRKKNIASIQPEKQLAVSLYKLVSTARTKETVLSILKSYLVDLDQIMDVNDVESLKKEYPAIVKYCYDISNDDIRTKSFDFYLPQSIIDLCVTLADPRPGSRIVLPFSRDAHFGYYMGDCSIVGHFNNDEVWAFAEVLHDSINAKTNFHRGEIFFLKDSFRNMDFVFTFPPILQGGKQKDLISKIYELLAGEIKDQGEMYCVVPMSFCYDSVNWFNLRTLILNDPNSSYSTCIIELPTVLQPLSSIKLCLVRIKKDYKGDVTLMDATEFYHKGKGTSGKLDIDALESALASSDEKYVWKGKNKELTFDLNVQPSRYLADRFIPQAKNGEKVIMLSELVSIESITTNRELQKIVSDSQKLIAMKADERERAIVSYKEAEMKRYPMVSMKELSSSYLNCDIKREGLPLSDKVEYRFLTKDCLLVGYMGDNFKVGRTHGVTPETPIALRQNIFPISLVSDNITEDYLLRSILQEKTLQQARNLSKGINITRLDKDDFLSLFILVPTLDEQEKAYKEDTRSSLDESDRKILDTYEDFRKDMHMKKHAIGQTLFNLNNWWDALQQARNEGNGVLADDALTGKVRKISVSSIYDKLQNAISQLQQQINKFDRGNGLTTEKFALTTFIEKYINRKQSPLFTFVYDRMPHYNIESVLTSIPQDEKTGRPLFSQGKMEDVEMPIEYAIFAPEALEIIFDNIISNACCHGFQGREDEANVIKIELLAEGDGYVITISNNGNPLHTQINPSEVFVYGKTSKMGGDTNKNEKHYGIGGYEVQKLMREFGGDAEIISESDSNFPVTYKLKFNNTYTKMLEYEQ